MHLIFGMQAAVPGCHGKLWLGGEYPSGDLALLEDNFVTVVFPASRKPAPVDSLNIKVLEYMDGTGLANDDVDINKALLVMDQVIKLMLDGHSVLICCKNGAHRSATLTVAMLIRLCGWSFERSDVYCSTLRNIVDLKSTAPPSSFRRSPRKPCEWLVDNQSFLATGSPGYAAATILTPVNFRKKAMALGFEVRGPSFTRPKAKSRPSADLGSGCSSFEMVSGADTFRGMATTDSSDASLPTPSKRSRAETASGESKSSSDDPSYATAEARAHKLVTMCKELEQLNLKMMSELYGKSSAEASVAGVLPPAEASGASPKVEEGKGLDMPVCEKGADDKKDQDGDVEMDAPSATEPGSRTLAKLATFSYFKSLDLDK